MSPFDPPFDLEPYAFRGDRLREIAFPLGGIGTGCISLDGRGGLRDWEIYGRPNKGSLLPYTFPLLWVQFEGEDPQVLTVQGPRTQNFIGGNAGFWTYGHGRFFDQMDGLPCFDSVEFFGTFPFARIRFAKHGFPVELELAAFNPFVPNDVEASSLPVANLTYRLKNLSGRDLQATLVWTMTNPIDEKADGTDEAMGETFKAKLCSGIAFSNAKFSPGDPSYGTAALATNWPHTTALPMWDRREWFDSLQAFWNSFSATGRLDQGPLGKPGERTPGSLGAHISLAPEEEAEVPFLVSWSFPTSSKYWDQKEFKDHTWTPHYAVQWPTAIDAADGFFRDFESLRDRTLAYERAFFTSDLPSDVLLSVSAASSTLHSPTVLRLEDGTFWAWEGCSPHEGCCAGTCSHVWNYALAHAYLFPEMQWSMRGAEYKHSFDHGPRGKDGALNFRVMIPLGAESNLWHAASDGQLGGVVQLYRDWKLSGDDAALRELWPSAKRALEYAWVAWDRDRDGLVDADEQHNTYDINFQGPNPLTQFFYLAALRAGEEISGFLQDEATSKSYRTLYASGRTLTEQRLFNGEYFFQENPHDGPEAPKYQHGIGCLSDQVFGQLAATVAGLGDLVDPALIQQALGAIFRHNFKDALGCHVNLQRVYAMPDEPGLILCSWPNGGRPDFPFVYSDEVWTGIEYQVATHLAYAGMESEALAIVAAIRKRYDGSRRNPWNEFECGSHYARAMASYGLMLALPGIRIEGEHVTVEKEGRYFFSGPKGWGQVVKVEGECQLEWFEKSPK
jgi:non-lysosomal glucosylceramidase